MLLTGCTDKALTADVALLKQEIASIKSDSRISDEISSIKSEISKIKQDLESFTIIIKEEIEAGKQRELTAAAAKKESQDRIGDLGRQLNETDGKVRASSERLDSLVNLLPLEKLSRWRLSGELACQQLTIKDATSSNITTATPSTIIQHSDSGGSVSISSTAESTGVLAKSKAGYLSGILVGDKVAELCVVDPDESYSKIFVMPSYGGFKSARKDEDKQNIAFFRMDTKNKTILSMSNAENTFLADAEGLELGKGNNRSVLALKSAKRGAKMAIYDDVGTSPKIALGLQEENGEPRIAVMGATQFDVMYPKTKLPK